MQTIISAKLFSQGIWKEIRTAILIIALIPQIYLAQAVNPNPDMAVPDGTVKAIIVKGDYTYIGGEFDYVGKNSGYGVKVTTTGSTIDPSYAKVNGTIYACVPDGNGGWYIGGSFTKVGSTSISYLARIKSDGSLDAGWTPNPDGVVYCLALNGTDLYVGGSFSTIGGYNRNNLAKVSTGVTAETDATWNPNADSIVLTMAIGGDWLYIGVFFTTIGGEIYNNLARVSLSGTGAADDSWNPSCSDFVTALVISGSDLFVGGRFGSVGGQQIRGLCKISVSNGTVDYAWNPNPNSAVHALAISGNDLYVGGGFTNIGGQVRNYCAKLSTTGTGAADASWDPGPDNVVNSLAVSGTDIYIGGYFTTVKGGTLRARAAKFSTTGVATLDAAWDPSVSPGSVNAIAISGSNIYLGGSFVVANSSPLPNLARINNLNGEVDPGWKPEPNGSVNALTTDNTYIYAGGAFTTVKGGTFRNNIARFSVADYGPADAWDPNINGDVNALLFDGIYIYAGGAFTTVKGGTPRNNIARFSVSVDATADPFWDQNINGPVYALEYDVNFIYAGGSFTEVNYPAVTRNNIARFWRFDNGKVDLNWDPNINGQVSALAYDGNFIYAGGWFNSVNGGTDRYNIARFPTNSSLVDSWAPRFNSQVNSLAVSGSEIFVGGEFTSVNDIPRKGIAKIFGDYYGQLDDYWDPNLGDFVSIRAIAISGADDVYLGGIFLNAGGNFQPNFALYTNRPLPVELASFTASARKGIVELDWQTATEVDNSGFEVQRAVAGTNNWTKMGFVEGHHTTNSPRYYSFRDQPSKTEGSKFRYRLKQIDNSGKFEYSNTIEVDLGSPVKFSLEQNYPNPFNPATVIQYQLPVPANVAIDLYSVSGEKITTLLSETKESGSHSFTFDATQYGLSSGIYFYRMTVITSSGEAFSSTRKLSLIK